MLSVWGVQLSRPSSSPAACLEEEELLGCEELITALPLCDPKDGTEVDSCELMLGLLPDVTTDLRGGLGNYPPPHPHRNGC